MKDGIGADTQAGRQKLCMVEFGEEFGEETHQLIWPMATRVSMEVLVTS